MISTSADVAGEMSCLVVDVDAGETRGQREDKARYRNVKDDPNMESGTWGDIPPGWHTSGDIPNVVGIAGKKRGA